MSMDSVIRWLEDVRLARMVDADYYSKRSRMPLRHVLAEQNGRQALCVYNAIQELHKYTEA